MAYRAFIGTPYDIGVSSPQNERVVVNAVIINDDTDLVEFYHQWEVGYDDFTTPADFKALVLAEAQAFADTNFLGTLSSIFLAGLNYAPSGLSAAPQAAIADAPADAVTNYNVVTTLLGALTGAVNTANTKQNDIATKLNTLLAELRTLGLIAS